MQGRSPAHSSDESEELGASSEDSPSKLVARGAKAMEPLAPAESAPAVKKRKEAEARRAALALYMCRIDNAYKTAKHDAEKNLRALRAEIKEHPRRFDNDWRNLSSWATGLAET